MNPQSMTLRETADHTRLTEKTLTRLAQSGELTATKIGRQWRFDRDAVDAWLATRPNPLSVASQPLPVEATGLPAPLTVANALTAERIKLNLLGASRDGLLRELVALVIPADEPHWAETLFVALKAREDLCSTCVDEGVAIPHARNALVGIVEKPVLAYGRHVVGMEFGALDGKPVHHFFLLCAPNVREHLQLLARLARLVKEPAFRAGLLAAAAPEDVLRIVNETESKLQLPG